MQISFPWLQIPGKIHLMTRKEENGCPSMVLMKISVPKKKMEVKLVEHMSGLDGGRRECILRKVSFQYLLLKISHRTHIWCLALIYVYMNTKYITQVKCLKPRTEHKEEMRNSERVSNDTKECPSAKQLKEAVLLQSRRAGNSARPKSREGHLLFSTAGLCQSCCVSLNISHCTTTGS